MGWVTPNSIQAKYEGQYSMTVQFWEIDKISADELARIRRRAEIDIRSLLPLAQDVIQRVQTEGDTAVIDYARKFDAPNFTIEALRATQLKLFGLRQRILLLLERL